MQLDPELAARDHRWVLPSLSYVLRRREGPVSLDVIFFDTTPFMPNYRQATDPGGDPYKTAGKHDDKVYNWRAIGCPNVTTPRGSRCFSGYLNDRLRDLDRQLSESNAQWKVVVGHHPIRSAGHHGDSEELLEAVDPL